jgi:NAD(P)-dependent dehydrogenase (short-subunit alcohol dehydrogenase family)
MPTAIVTGASRGLGYALTAQLADAGWHVIVDARDAEALGTAAETLRAAGWHPDSRIEAIPGDITDAAHRADLVAAATAAGGLDLLVNNAGILGPSPLPATGALGADDLRAIVEVNVLAPLALTQLALPLLRASGGVLIDITSDAAVEAYPGWGGYGAAKAATEQLRNVLAAEEAEASTGVTVWRVDPGDLRTEMHQLAFPGEDISDRPLPETVAPGLPALLAARPPSGRYRLADYVPAEPPAASGPTALWLTIEVPEYAPATAFYRDILGLAEVDSWSDGAEQGAVYAVGPAGRIEVERPATPASQPAAPAAQPARAAIEYPSLEALTAAHAAITERLRRAGHDGDTSVRPTPVIHHHRGHSGFTLHDPYGTEIYLWSEK